MLRKAGFAVLVLAIGLGIAAISAPDSLELPLYGLAGGFAAAGVLAVVFGGKRRHRRGETHRLRMALGVDPLDAEYE